MDGPRPVKPEEFGELIKLVDRVFQNGDPIMESAYPAMFSRRNWENLLVIRQDDRLVSHLGIVFSDAWLHNCRVTTASIGSVCTAPEYERRGLASLLLQAAFEKCTEQNAQLVIVSGDRGLYRRSGCFPAGTVTKYEITRDTVDRLEAKGVALSPFNRGTAPTMSRLYRLERACFHRPAYDFRMFVQSGMAMMYKVKTMVVKKSREPAACLTLALPGDNDLDRAVIVESFGNRESLVQSLPLLFEQYSPPAIEWAVTGWDGELANLLGALGLQPKVEPFPGTFRIHNFPGLMERMRPHFSNVLGKKAADHLAFAEQDGTFIISLKGGSSVKIDGREKLNKLIFGFPGTSITNIIEGDRDIIKTLEANLPIPLLWPGLNYV